MSGVDPTDALSKMAEALGLSGADLARLADRVADDTPVPTVADLATGVREACTEKSLPTYSRHFNALVKRFGDQPVTDITANHLCALRDDTIATTARDRIERAERNGRQLRTYEHDAHGRGAGENAVRAFRFFFRYALKEGLVVRNVAMDVEVPKRLPAPERPLVPWELEEVATVWCTTGDDPELDTMLLEFHRKTAARREGGLNLRLGALDVRRGAITLTEKFGKTRELPYDADGLARLRRFAISRGATSPSDHVFRSKRGTKVSRKRYETIYDRLDRHTSWTEQLDLGAHWIRHTTLDDVRTVAGERVAAAYVGHEDTSGDTIARYTKVTFEELAAAFEAIFGPRFADGDAAAT